MKKKYLAIALGFPINVIANSILAFTILNPLLNKKIGIVRDAKVGLNFPALLIGLFLFTIFIVILNIIIPGKTWLQKGIKAGALSAFGVNITGYLIVSGWSIANGWAMFAASLFDGTVTILVSLSIALILKDNEPK
jgi:hypothetical protein